MLVLIFYSAVAFHTMLFILYFHSLMDLIVVKLADGL